MNLRPFAVFLALSIAWGSSLSAAQVQHFWNFEGGFDDQVGTADGSVTGTTSVGSIVGADGGTAGAFRSTVTGPDDWVDVPVSDLYNPGTGAFSMSYWIQLGEDMSTNPRGIFDFGGNGGDGPQSLYIGNSGNLAFRIDGTSGGAAALVPLPEDGAWHCVVGTYEPGRGIEVHIDGFGVDGSVPGDFGDVVHNFGANPGDAYIGSFNFTGTSQEKGANGGVDDVALYSGVLSDAQIQGVCDGSLSPLQVPEPGTGLPLACLAWALSFRRRPVRMLGHRG